VVRLFINAYCFSTDFDKQQIDGLLRFPAVSIIGKYEAAGRILVLPLTGNGNINITLGNNAKTFTGALYW
jgi:hypothetical protein